MPAPRTGLRFNLRSTLGSPSQLRAEEASSLLTTHVHESSNASVPCAVQGGMELAKLNLRPAVRPMGRFAPTRVKYAQLDTEEQQPALSNNAGCRLGCCIACLCLVAPLATAAAVLIHILHTVGHPPPPPSPPAPRPPPMTTFQRLGALVAITSGAASKNATRPPRARKPLGGRRIPPPPPPPPPPSSPRPPPLVEGGSGVLYGV